MTVSLVGWKASACLKLETRNRRQTEGLPNQRFGPAKRVA